MSTPAAPVAAPPAAAAPSAAPTPAPAAPSTPAAPPAAQQTPQAPQAPQAPAVDGAQPPAAPAAAQAPQAPAGPPKAEDFPSSEEGIEQYIEAAEKYRSEHPDEAAKADEERRLAAEAAQPGAQPEEKPAAEQRPPAVEAPATPEVPATPAAFDEMISKKPAFKALFEADPEAKGVVMEMARSVELAKPVLAIVPTVEEARFAVENSGRLLDVTHGLAMSGEMPELGETAWNQVIDMFTLRDAEGKPMQKDGAPVLGEGFDFLARKIYDGGFSAQISAAKTRHEALKQQVATGIFPNQAAKDKAIADTEQAEYELAALNYSHGIFKKALDPAEEMGGLPPLPDDATPAQKEFQAKLQKDLDEVNRTRTGNTRQQRQQARATFEKKMKGSWGDGVGVYVDNELKAMRDRGEFVPDLILNRPWINPATGQQTKVPTYQAEIYNAFNAKIESIPTVKAKLRNLELQGPPAEAARQEYYAQLRKDYLPPIFREYIDTLNKGVRSMAEASTQKRGQVAQVARVEPQSVHAPAATQNQGPLTGEALAAKVQENLANNAEYQSASPVDKAEMEILERERLRSGRAA